MPHLRFFRLKCEKYYFIFEISILEFVKYEFLTNIVNLTEVPEVNRGFSEGSFLGPGPLYKV